MARKGKPVKTTVTSRKEDAESETFGLQVTLRKGELSLAYLLAERGIIAGIQKRLDSAIEDVVEAFVADAEQIVRDGYGRKCPEEGIGSEQ